MTDDRDDSLLTVLEPPPRGWERLISRRAASETRSLGLLAFGGGVVAAALVLFVFDIATIPSVKLSLDGTRFQERPASSEPLRMLDASKVSPLPAAEGVRAYWTESPGG